MRVRFKRAWCFLLIAIGVGAISWLCITYFIRDNTIKAAFDKIELGMKPHEVHDILGFDPIMAGGGRGSVDALWIGPAGEYVIVYFSRTGGVTDKKFVESTLPLHERLWKNLRESFTGEFKRQNSLPRDWDPWGIRGE